MPIQVTRVSEALYSVSASPPHVEETWTAATPLRFHQLLKELLSRGAHHIDISDAVTDADRAWLTERQLRDQQEFLDGSKEGDEVNGSRNAGPP